MVQTLPPNSMVSPPAGGILDYDLNDFNENEENREEILLIKRGENSCFFGSYL